MSNGRPWTRLDDQNLERLAQSGLTDKQIGKHMKRHPKLIGVKRRDMNITPGVPAALQAMMARINLRRRLRTGR